MTTIAHDRPIDLAVSIEAGDTAIEADWTIPLRPRGTILVVNGAGNSRSCRRNRETAKDLHDEGFATLIVDLLTHEEEQEDALTGSLRLDVDLLARRITTATRWVRNEPDFAYLPIGYLASGVASAGALVAASRNSADVAAVVSRSGRVDLAGINLHKVEAPTLLIVGGADPQTFELNRWALRRLNCEKRITTIPRATHQFAEAGTLTGATRMAIDWFERFMERPRQLTTRRSMFAINFSERRTDWISR